MKRILIAVVVVAALGGLGWLGWQRIAGQPPADRLYGNVEIRQVDLSFNSEGTVTVMRKHEGDAVADGEAVAEIDPATYQSLVALSQARRDAAQAALAKLLNGTRPEDITQAKAAVANAHAVLADAQATFARAQTLVRSDTVSRQTLDDARRGLDSAAAQVALTEAALAEAVVGPRVEDIDAAKAQLRESEASLDLARTQLNRAVLRATGAGVVMTRVIEPGTVVVPGSAVYSVALTNEVWVRAFVPEPMLARAAPGKLVKVYTDGRPDRPYEGSIGYVSPSAEFTPKTVETPELRTQLVYRLRIRLTHPDDGIRQGQPVSIDLAP